MPDTKTFVKHPSFGGWYTCDKASVRHFTMLKQMCANASRYLGGGKKSVSRCNCRTAVVEDVMGNPTEGGNTRTSAMETAESQQRVDFGRRTPC